MMAKQLAFPWSNLSLRMSLDLTRNHCGSSKIGTILGTILGSGELVDPLLKRPEDTLRTGQRAKSEERPKIRGQCSQGHMSWHALEDKAQS